MNLIPFGEGKMNEHEDQPDEDMDNVEIGENEANEEIIKIEEYVHDEDGAFCCYCGMNHEYVFKIQLLGDVFFICASRLHDLLKEHEIQ